MKQLLCMAALATTLLAQPVTFPDVKLRYISSPKAPSVADERGILSLDDAAGKLDFQSKKLSFQTSYSNVRRILFDLALGRGGMLALSLSGYKFVPGVTIVDQWMLMEYTQADGSTVSRTLVVPAKSWVALRDKVNAAFGGRVTFTEPRLGTIIDSKTLEEAKAKFTYKADWKERPKPEGKPGMALIVVVCPYISWTGGGLYQYKVHANNRVILVNKQGTFGFANLEPGEYEIVSENLGFASALTVKMEAGKAYYFVQDVHGDEFVSPALSQRSEELVMQEVSGSGYSSWERQAK